MVLRDSLFFHDQPHLKTTAPRCDPQGKDSGSGKAAFPASGSRRGSDRCAQSSSHERSCPGAHRRRPACPLGQGEGPKEIVRSVFCDGSHAGSSSNFGRIRIGSMGGAPSGLPAGSCSSGHGRVAGLLRHHGNSFGPSGLVARRAALAAVVSEAAGRIARPARRVFIYQPRCYISEFGDDAPRHWFPDSVLDAVWLLVVLRGLGPFICRRSPCFLAGAGSDKEKVTQGQIDPEAALVFNDQKSRLSGWVARFSFLATPIFLFLGLLPTWMAKISERRARRMQATISRKRDVSS